MQAHKNIPDDISAINEACFKLNSLQIGALLRQCSDNVAPPLIEIAVRNAESIADELIKGDGREVVIYYLFLFRLILLLLYLFVKFLLNCVLRYFKFLFL